MDEGAPTALIMAAVRKRIIAGVGLVALPALVWAPGVIAARYDDDPSRTPLRPDRGWQFILDVVRESRGADLGWHDAALTRAREVWVSGPRTSDVSLRWGPREYRIPVPAGGVEPTPRKRVARLRSELNWVVTGRLPGRPHQVIGILDYRTGAVVWNIRPIRRTT